MYLQRAVERITGEPLDVLIGRLVFAPLRMRNSSFVWQEWFETDHALPHDEAQRPAVRAKPADGNAAYSLQTTAADYARFLQAVLAGTRLKQTTARLWLDPHVNVPKDRFECLDPDGPELDRHVAWGLGLGIEPGAGTFFHWGSNVGANSFAIGALGSICSVYERRQRPVDRTRDRRGGHPWPPPLVGLAGLCAGATSVAGWR